MPKDIKYDKVDPFTGRAKFQENNEKQVPYWPSKGRQCVCLLAVESRRGKLPRTRAAVQFCYNIFQPPTANVTPH